MTTGLAATALLASCAGLGAAPGESAPAVTGSAAVASSAPATPSATAAATESATPEATATVEAPASATASATPAAAARAAVVPFITSATWDASSERLDVSAIVPKVVEPSGRCTVTAVKGDATATVSGPAAPASSYTGCSQLAIGGSELTSGTWSVTVSYASDESAGTSAARTVTVG